VLACQFPVSESPPLYPRLAANCFFLCSLQLSSHRSSSFYPLFSILIVRPLPSGIVALRLALCSMRASLLSMWELAKSSRNNWFRFDGRQPTNVDLTHASCIPCAFFFPRITTLGALAGLGARELHSHRRERCAVSWPLRKVYQQFAWPGVDPFY